MLFLFDKSETEKKENFYENIDFDIIMCIAIIEIYLKEKWVEPLIIPKYPYEILYHQTISHIVSVHSITPASLATSFIKSPGLQSAPPNKGSISICLLYA